MRLITKKNGIEIWAQFDQTAQVYELFFDNEGHCRDHDPDGIYYQDDNHLSRYGVSLLLGPQLRDLLRGIGESCAATR